MNKLIQPLYDRLSPWAQDWVGVSMPLIEVTLIAVTAWLLMRVARQRLDRVARESDRKPVASVGRGLAARVEPVAQRIHDEGFRARGVGRAAERLGREAVDRLDVGWGFEPEERGRHGVQSCVRKRCTSSAVTALPRLPKLPRTWFSTAATSSLLRVAAKGGMPKGRGLPAVAGA